ncbi:MAG: phosphate acyltransferase PlsX [Erysipelotrichaceae bacterium]|nr:phosphate acyltransferase PlsX [Erysipelotrichaceae bacterium]
MKIAIDALGNDKGSTVFVQAIKKFTQDYKDVELIVFTNHESEEAYSDIQNAKLILCQESIQMDDGLMAIKRKKDASMNKMIDHISSGLADGGISAGSTAALLMSSLTKLKTIENVERPALLATIPAKNGRFFQFLDMGANSDTTANNLLEFAKIGKVYAEVVYKIKNPRIKLLNIGAEAAKGDKLHKEAYDLLAKANDLNFCGNIEGRDMFDDDVDVIVSDGFSGNITLKAVEGTAQLAFGELKNVIMASGISKLAGLVLKKGLSKIKDNLDYSKFGGAILIGLQKPVVKAHGASSEEAIYNALICLYKILINDTVEKLKRELQ